MTANNTDQVKGLGVCMTAATFQQVEGRIKALEAYDGFMDGFETEVDAIRHDMMALLHQLKAQNSLDDPTYAQYRIELLVSH